MQFIFTKRVDSAKTIRIFSGMNNKNNMNDENPKLLTKCAESIRDHFKNIGCECEWICTYFNGSDATIKDINGKYWDVDVNTGEIWEA